MCNFGTLTNGQVSYPNMAILKIGLYLGKCSLQSKNKLNYMTPQGRKRVYVQRLDLLSATKFNAQIRQFWISACISETAAHRAKISSISTPCDRKKLYVQLLVNFGQLPISCPNMAILKIGLYLGNHCIQSKNKLNFIPLGQKESICAPSGTLASVQVSCPNVAILKWALSRKSLPVERK